MAIHAANTFGALSVSLPTPRRSHAGQLAWQLCPFAWGGALASWEDGKLRAKGEVLNPEVILNLWGVEFLGKFLDFLFTVVGQSWDRFPGLPEGLQKDWQQWPSGNLMAATFIGLSPVPTVSLTNSLSLLSGMSAQTCSQSLCHDLSLKESPLRYCTIVLPEQERKRASGGWCAWGRVAGEWPAGLESGPSLMFPSESVWAYFSS